MGKTDEDIPVLIIKKEKKKKKKDKNFLKTEENKENEENIISRDTNYQFSIINDNLGSSIISNIENIQEINKKRIILNVGGKKFETYIDTFTKFGTSTMLGAMFLSFHSNQIKDEYFLDRDPELFKSILQWYRTGYFCAPPGIPKEILIQELDFYGIPIAELNKTFKRIFTLCGKKLWSCKKCGTNLTLHKDLHSKGFRGKTGDAYLFNNVVNVRYGRNKKKELSSGTHLIQNVYCISCDEYLGWKYEEAFDSKNKYKEGKTILEKSLMIKEIQKK